MLNVGIHKTYGLKHTRRRLRQNVYPTAFSPSFTAFFEWLTHPFRELEITDNALMIFGLIQLRALSSVLERSIEVIQPEGRCAVFGEEFASRKPITITFHRYAYNLGEHYNSTDVA
ncbi:unnamed protein product [Toxocara canis]|uniref:Ubiquitinyl hydrolase 1 n=1 Tax=Toxocara canis TaxID=6265 RepID=A0A183U984_TOXCA|nr:unnamed protein product [Toxocara canis]